MTDVRNSEVSRRGRGRPPSFDRRQVLEQAGRTFWILGYEGASISDLTAAMGISAQSLYAAFGSKAALYEEVLAWYGDAHGGVTPDDLAAADVVTTLGRLLRQEAVRFADPKTPPGCLISTALLGCAVENDAVAALASGLRNQTIEQVRGRLELARDNGALAPTANPDALARLVGATLQGLSIQARDGADARQLSAVADLVASMLEGARSEEGRR